MVNAKSREEKLLYWSVYYRTHKQQRDAYNLVHKKEKAEREKTYGSKRAEYARSHKEQRQVYHVMHRYGVSPEVAAMLIFLRDGKGAWCYICRTEKGPFQIDHSHSTKEVRGILCGPCNRRVGEVELSLPSVSSYLGLSR